MSDPKAYADLRAAVSDLCRRFPDEYWRESDAANRYPEESVFLVDMHAAKPGSITITPISTNLILSYLAEHVLGLPRSY